jgi:orotidine-5'-phosphate decarboxylase
MNQLFEGLNTGVIVACDVSTKEELYNLIEKTNDVEGIVGYKLGFMLGTGFGLRNIGPEIKSYTDKPIIYDHQKAGTDIPAMGENFGKLLGESQIDAGIIFPLAGPATQEGFIEGIINNGVIPISGGEMTHDKFLAKDGGYIRDDAPDEMYDLSLVNTIKDFVLPGNKPDAIRRYVDGPFRNFKNEIAIHSPGHGKQGGILSEAIKAAFPVRYFGIVGGGIYKQDDITAAAEKWANEALDTWKDLEERAKQGG